MTKTIFGSPKNLRENAKKENKKEKDKKIKEN